MRQIPEIPWYFMYWIAWIEILLRCMYRIEFKVHCHYCFGVYIVIFFCCLSWLYHVDRCKYSILFLLVSSNGISALKFFHIFHGVLMRCFFSKMPAGRFNCKRKKKEKNYRKHGYLEDLGNIKWNELQGLISYSYKSHLSFEIRFLLVRLIAGSKSCIHVWRAQQFSKSHVVVKSLKLFAIMGGIM